MALTPTCRDEREAINNFLKIICQWPNTIHTCVRSTIEGVALPLVGGVARSYMKVVRLRVRIVFLLGVAYISLMVSLYLYLSKRNALSLQNFATDSRTRILSFARYEEKKSEDARISFKRTADQPI